MSFILGFINFHVLREVDAIFFSMSSGMNFNYVEPGILRTKYLCVGSDDQKKVLRTSLESWELFGGKIGGGRVPPMFVRLLVVHTP